MPTLNKIHEGFNKYCGPAVLAAITGKDTDTCAREIGYITGQSGYKVKAVYTKDLLKAADRLGFLSRKIEPSRSVYSTIINLVGFEGDGIYIISLETHFIVIEISNKQVFICDNHTKEPINAASSARLSQVVKEVHKVWPKPEYKAVERKEITIINTKTLNKEAICKLLGVSIDDSLVTFVVPTGGDYSGDTIEIDDDCPIVVTTTMRSYE